MRRKTKSAVTNSEGEDDTSRPTRLSRKSLKEAEDESRSDGEESAGSDDESKHDSNERSRKRKQDDNPEEPAGEDKENRKSSKKSISKKHLSDISYEVEAIVGERVIKGRIQYKVRWKGYSSDDDTWENESSLDCNELIEEYNDSKSDEPETSAAPSAAIPKSSKTKKSPKKNPSKSQAYGKCGPTENGEWEVLKIIDMHTLKTGKREFLVRWKGYPPEDDSWEPEEHLEGTQILQTFLDKVEKLRSVSEKELRVSRKPTNRYMVMPQGDRRRESKRYQNKERVRYYDAE